MNCAEKLLEPTIFFNLYTKSPEFRFRKSLAQERFKSNLEFRYQIIESSIKFRKGLAEFMKPIALFKKFLSQQFIASVEISNMARCSAYFNYTHSHFTNFRYTQFPFHLLKLHTLPLY